MTDRTYLFGKTGYNDNANMTKKHMNTSYTFTNGAVNYEKPYTPVMAPKVKTITLGGRGCETTRDNKKNAKMSLNWE